MRPIILETSARLPDGGLLTLSDEMRVARGHARNPLAPLCAAATAMLIFCTLPLTFLLGEPARGAEPPSGGH